MNRRVRDKLQTGELTLGSWLQIGSPTVAELMALSRFDWLALDCEHGLIDLETAGLMIAAIERHGVAPFVRLPVNDATWVHRMLDAGAGGIIVPMVGSGAEAAAAVAAAKYPPAGTRGYGFARANAYGATFAEYVAQANDAISVVVQIEHIDAVRRADEILSTPGVDGALIGPYDLSGSMGITGQMDHPQMLAAMDEVVQACRRQKKSAGLHVVSTDPTEATEAVSKGFTFVALGMDDQFIGAGSSDLLSTVQEGAAVERGTPETTDGDEPDSVFHLIAGQADRAGPQRQAPNPV